MNIYLRQYLRRYSLEFHLIIGLAIGLVLRLFSAYFVYGPQALDDYKHGVWPAYQFFTGLPMDLPDYRSHLLTWLLASFLKVGQLFGVESALAQVRTMYIGLGLISLLAIVGAYVYARTFRSRTFGGLAIYLMAAYPAMPFVGTRAFGESVALAFVLLGFALCEYARARKLTATMAAGFLVLGIGVLFRFQAGIIAAVYFAFLSVKQEWRLLVVCAGAGLLLVGVQAAIDVASGKAAFQTLQAYMDANAGGAAQYGVSPWYNTWLLVLGFTLFPFSLVFVPRLKYTLHRHLPLFVALLLFVLIHSLIPHKEERFMYPILGLVLVLLADVWALSRHRRWAQRIYQPVFLFIGVLGLTVACFVNTQAGEIQPAAEAEAKLRNVGYLEHESLFGKSMINSYFLRPPSLMFKIEKDGFSLPRAHALLVDTPALQGIAFLTSSPAAYQNLRELAGRSEGELHCGQPKEASSMVDRLLYRLNPKHNQRRRPTLYILCEKR